MMKKVLGLIGIAIYLACAIQSFAFNLEWETKQPMFTGRSDLASVALNGKIYAIGGGIVNEISFEVVEEFNPTIGTNGTWTTKAPMPTGRWGLAAATLNGKIYAIGGGGGPKVVEEFDPTVGPNGTWIQKSPMPTGRDGLVAVALNGKIYAIGGNGGLNVVEEFDPTVGPSGTWTRKADMPTGRSLLAAVALNGKIYAIGGYDNGGLNVV
ncbi:MAG: hypothetical protein QME42_08070 [bacterium]|nr:hypothetical protein [bacterium]